MRLSSRSTWLSLDICIVSAEERLEGASLEEWLNMVNAPMELAAFLRGRD